MDEPWRRRGFHVSADEPTCVVVLEGAGAYVAVVGDGRTLAEALTNTRDWYDNEPICAHCGHIASGAEKGWRAFAIDERAYGLLTCGGECLDAFRMKPHEYLWAQELARFVLLEAECIACRGDGEDKWGVHCDQCSGCGTLDREDLDGGEWIEPPPGAELWCGG